MSHESGHRHPIANRYRRRQIGNRKEFSIMGLDLRTADGVPWKIRAPGTTICIRDSGMVCVGEKHGILFLQKWASERDINIDNILDPMRTQRESVEQQLGRNWKCETPRRTAESG